MEEDIEWREGKREGRKGNGKVGSFEYKERKGEMEGRGA